MTAGSAITPARNLALLRKIALNLVAADRSSQTSVRGRRAPCKGGAFQWVQGPPGESLQPEAIGAVMEVTKWLKPSISGHNW